MKKKKDNKTLFFVFLAIILTIIALIATSGTYAKYTSSITTTASEGTVAKWLVKVNEKDITTSSDPIEFDIFGTNIKDSDGIATEDDVAAGKLAPGIAGNFQFDIANESEVNIKYSIEFSETNESNIPIEYSMDGNNFYSASKLTEELNKNENKVNMNGTKNVKVYWRWAYESTDDALKTTKDNADTTLGKNANETATLPKYIVSATLVATQVD